MTTKDNGKYVYRKKIYNIITCYAELQIPIVCKYQMVKENGEVFKELHPYKAETMLANGQIIKYQPLNQ